MRAMSERGVERRMFLPLARGPKACRHARNICVHVHYTLHTSRVCVFAE